MLNPHRRRPPTSSLATNNARPLRRRIRFRGGAPLVINIPEPRLALSPAQPLRSSLRAAPLARSLDAELQLGAALSERRPFGVVPPINRVYARGDRAQPPPPPPPPVCCGGGAECRDGDR